MSSWTDRLTAWMRRDPNAQAFVAPGDIEPLTRHAMAVGVTEWPEGAKGPLSVVELLARMTPANLLALDERVRHWDSGIPFDIRHAFIDTALGAPPALRDAALFVQSTSRHGHVRERALRESRSYPSRLQLIATILRLSDWVPEVRALATESLVTSLPGAPVDGVVEVLPLLLRLRLRSRVDQAAIAQALLAWLKQPGNLDAALGHPSGPVRQWAYDGAFALPGIDHADLVPRALADADPAVALRGLQETTALADYERMPWLRRAFMAAHPTVRLAAMRTLDAQGLLSKDDLTLALGDRSGGMRAAAIYLLRTRHGIDAVGIYREWMASELGALPPVNQGFSETATADDAAMLTAMLDSPRGIVRASALQAIARIGLPIDEALALKALTDPSNRVVDAWLRIAHRDVLPLDAPRLMRLTLPVRDQLRDRVMFTVGPNQRLDLLCAAVPLTEGQRAWVDHALLRMSRDGKAWWKPDPRQHRALTQLKAQRDATMDPQLRSCVEAALASI
ncbi:hypothetical protein KPL74_04255 [Bacillus sp. NP157]|nr:hypothetical protein KPL74_04255 [Bacillus sp. NP157]